MANPDLVKRVRTLEESNRRWKMIAITALSVLGVVLVVGGVFGTMTHLRLLNEQKQLVAATEEARRQQRAAEEALQRAQQEQQLLAKERQAKAGELRQPTPAELRQAEDMARKLLEGLKP